jgi:tetratricopeptide (TPR) repeat protein
MRLKKYDQAEYYTNLRKPSADTKVWLARIYSRQGKYHLALEQAEEAVLFDSTNGEALRQLASQHIRLDQLDEAEFYLKKVIEVEGNYFSYNQMAWLLIKNDRNIDRGIQMGLKALKLRTEATMNNIKTWHSKDDKIGASAFTEYVLGIAYQKKGDYEKAVEYLEKAHQLFPEKEGIKPELEKARTQLVKVN